MAKRDREPKAAVEPAPRQVKSENPPQFDAETIAWQFCRLDWKHEHWGFQRLRPDEWRDLRNALASFEGQTWSSLKQTYGGRGEAGGTNHHSLELDQICQRARKRLEELNLDDYDSVFSLRLENRLRIYGIRDGRVLQIVWYDPHHGSRNAVYITKDA